MRDGPTPDPDAGERIGLIHSYESQTTRSSRGVSSTSLGTSLRVSVYSRVQGPLGAGLCVVVEGISSSSTFGTRGHVPTGTFHYPTGQGFRATVSTRKDPEELRRL